MTTATTFTETEQTKVYKSMHYGWTAETRIKIDGKNWVLTTSKHNGGSISTHCHAVQDEGNGSISFIMFGGDANESFHVNIIRGAKATENTIREAHNEGLKQFYAKRDAGELPKETEEDKIKIGTVLFTDGTGPQRRRAVYEITGNNYKTVLLDGTALCTDSNFIRPISKKFGIGTYFKPNDFITQEEINELIPKAKAAMQIKAEQDAIKAQEAAKVAEEKKAYLSQFTRADRRTTTNILKAHILATWPSVQIVGIKTDSFSGGDSMDVTYHAPERIEELETFVRSFREGTFDGMTDMYEYTKDRQEIIIDGHILQSYKYASSHFQQCEEKVFSAAINVAPGSAKIVHNQSKDGIEIYFPSKPNVAILDAIKASGFRWGKFNKCWYARISSRTIATAEKYGSLPSTLQSAKVSEKEYDKSKAEDHCYPVSRTVYEGGGYDMNEFDNMIIDQQAERIGA